MEFFVVLMAVIAAISGIGVVWGIFEVYHRVTQEPDDTKAVQMALRGKAWISISVASLFISILLVFAFAHSV